ncbi:hypothetical protein BUY84_09265 [Staphylococcus equorum]|nr:hypothetical protein BUY84_09265 [Staphylococcus equorum]
MAFIKVLSTSAIFALISILSMAFKEFILNKESSPVINLTIEVSTFLFFISMIVCLILYFIQIKDKRAKTYHKLFYILLVFTPVFVILLNVYMK